MTRRSRKHGSGFTMIELMMVVATIGVLATAATIYMRPVVKTIDVANSVGDLVREASRRAVSLGPVRSDVAFALTSRKARTRVRAAGTGQPTFVLERLEEAPPPATTASWIQVSTYTVDRAVIAESYANGVAPRGSLSASADWSGFVAQCYPDGTCDPRSVYFQLVKPSATSENFARMSIMPIGGAILTRKDWN